MAVMLLYLADKEFRPLRAGDDGVEPGPGR